jgi:uncharacterized protein YbjT (DUF2867 family)
MTDADIKTVLLAGASGLTGAAALDALLAAPEIGRVIAVSRRPLARLHPRLANRIALFDQLESQLKGVSCDAALCCLGTTLRRAGSEQAFRAVDVDAVLAFARAARAAGAQRFVVISSAAADPRSRNFYLRTKGEMEEALQQLQFPALDILQPSLLLGSRAELRPAERAAVLVMPLVSPLLRGNWIIYRGVAPRVVGQAMLGAIRAGRRGLQRYTYEGILSLARTGQRARPVTAPKAPAAR